LRALHGSPALVYDHAIAKAAQAMLASKACGGVGFSGTESYKAERGYKYENCGENWYYEANEESLIENDAATA
jgi:uncharacterized protein YkwD